MSNISKLIVIVAITFSLFGYLSFIEKDQAVNALSAGSTESMDLSLNGVPQESALAISPISTDGRYLTFSSFSSTMVSQSVNNVRQAYLRDRKTNTPSLVSQNTSGLAGNAASTSPSISATGRYVTFISYGTNLAPEITSTSNYQVYLRDTLLNTTKAVSVSSAGAASNSWNNAASVSADGQYVTFGSGATNLVSGITSGSTNIFMKDMISGQVTLISKNASNQPGNGSSVNPAVSCDGRIITFRSNSNNLIPGDATLNPNKTLDRIYIYDRLNSSLQYLKADNTSTFDGPTLSCNGNFVGFVTTSSSITDGDTNNISDAFIYDRISNIYERVSVGSGNTQSIGCNDGGAGVTSPRASDSGRFIGFGSCASDIVSNDANNSYDAFLRDRALDTTIRISTGIGGTEGNGMSGQPILSADASVVTFGSSSTNMTNPSTIPNVMHTYLYKNYIFDY